MERAAVESAMSDLRDALKGDDRDKIETKTAALSTAAAGLSQKGYEQAQQGGNQQSAGQGATDDSGVMDAEFEEVKDGKGKPGPT
jgi:molecular chaperone DnaK